MSVTRTFTVTVVSTGAGNKYAIDGVQQDTVNLAEGYTYKFDQSDSSNSSHPLRFSTTSDGTHNSGSEYTTGVTTNGTPGSADAYTQITVAASAPTLYYYCTNHSGMGGQANTVDSNTWGVLPWNQNLWGSQDGIDVSVTGFGLTSSIGSVTVDAEINSGWGRQPWNENAWGIQGDVLLDGQQATASVGSISPADVMGVTGVSSTVSVGSPLVIADITQTLTGVSATASVGSISPADVMGVSGVSATVSVGSISPADVIGVSGVSATTSIGEVSITSNPTVILSGVSATSSVGEIVGIPTAVGLTGQLATSSVNADGLILKYYGKLDPKTSTGDTTKTPKTSVSGYNPKTPKNTTGYTTKTPA